MTRDLKLKDRLKRTVDSFSSSSVLVVGDIMLDQFVWGEVSRISPEAPVPVVNVQKETFLLGGAANVANNLRSLGAGTMLSGIVGEDSFGEKIQKLSREMRIDTRGLIKTSRPTTMKTRIVARGQQVVRVDREKRRQPAPSTLEALRSRLEALLEECHCIMISDYDKGVICPALMAFLSEQAAGRDKFLLIDPKPSNYMIYKGATIITPNEKEARAMSGIQISDEGDIERAAAEIAATLEARGVLITRGARGMVLWQEDMGMFSIPTMAREVFDVTGAGDTVISVLALSLAAGLRMCEAAYLANIAAGIVVGKVGTAAVNREDLLKGIETAPPVDLAISEQ